MPLVSAIAGVERSVRVGYHTTVVDNGIQLGRGSNGGLRLFHGGSFNGGLLLGRATQMRKREYKKSDVRYAGQVPIKGKQELPRVSRQVTRSVLTDVQRIRAPK